MVSSNQPASKMILRYDGICSVRGVHGRHGGRVGGRAFRRAGAHLPCDSFCLINMKIFVCFVQQASLLAPHAYDLGGICQCS
jgi:hypothetical protein